MIRVSVIVVIVLIMVTLDANQPMRGQDLAQHNSAQKVDNPPPPAMSSYEFAKRDWDALISQWHSNKPPSDAEVNAFVLRTMGVEPEAAAAGISVCSAGLYQISGGEDESLVASLDVNGRHFCNEIELVSSSSGSITFQGIDAWEVDDVSEVVHDVARTGEKVLVVPTSFSDYEGAECVATWSHVYVMQSGSIIDRSSSFRDVYLDRLEVLRTKLQEANHVDTTCTQIEVDKIVRFLGLSPQAGEDKAREWIKSSDTSLRLKGILVLADIGDRDSVAALEHLAEDPDRMIGNAAKSALVSRDSK